LRSGRKTDLSKDEAEEEEEEEVTHIKSRDHLAGGEKAGFTIKNGG
jgi:hypothetical protein